MITRLLIALGIALLVVAGVAFLAFRAPADGPTRRTSPENLAPVTLPADLPRILPAPATETPYGPLYADMLALYRRRHADLTSEPPERQAVRELMAALAAAMDAGGDSPGFLDQHIPMIPAGNPAFEDALETTAALAVDAVARAAEENRTSDARRIALSLWALGQRAYADNVRLYPRALGLTMIASAGTALHDMGDNSGVSEQDLAAWGAAIDRIDRAWTDKLQIVRGVDPPVGDLIRIAQQDGDRMFRVEAMLQLGIAQHTAEGRGNRRAIRKAIESARSDPDEMVAQAAAAAESFTVEQMRRVR